MLKRVINPIDRSPRLSRSLEWLSNTLAKRRGLLPLVGVLLVVVSFLAQLLTPLFPAQQAALHTIWVLTHHLGIIIALVGLLLVEPLGS